MRLFFIVCFVMLSSLSKAQKQANIWYLENYGIDFNQSPPSILEEVAYHQNRAMGIANDKDGKLLFYTDNFTVFNAEHNKMPNGQNFFNPTQTSSIQSSVVVKKPGSETLYYVFLVEPQNLIREKEGLYYFVVDMTLDNGKGDVSVRPQKLVSSTSNKLAAIFHENRTDVWIVTQINNTNTYKIFLITEDGISSPITTSEGTNVGSFTAQLKFSPDGTKLASADDYNINLFDFDAKTGQISNPRLLLLPQSLRPSAVSFSPDGTKLYAANQSVVQYDVSFSDISLIKASEKILKDYVNNLFYNFQLATDGKIYITKGGGGGTSDYLGAITHPNALGIETNVVERYLYLQGFDSFVNFTPVFIESYFLQPDIIIKNTCFNDETELSLSNTRYVQGVKWSLGDGNPHFSMDVQHRFSIAKTWEIEAEVDYGSHKVVVRKEVVINPLPEFDLGPNRTICDSVSLTLNKYENVTYNWSTGDTTRIFFPRSSGLYSVSATNKSTGCKYYDEVSLIVNQTPFVKLGPDSVVCNKPPYVLKSRTNLSNVAYKWNKPFITAPQLTVENGGFYFLEAKSLVNGCIHRDSIFIGLKYSPEPDLGPDKIINLDESFVLDMSQDGPGIFQWENNSVQPKRIFSGRDLGVGEHNISLSITSTNGCSGRDEMAITVLNIVGLKEEEEVEKYKLYPIPSNHSINIEAPGKIHVSLITTTGKLLIEQTLESGKGSLDISNLASGMYIVLLSSQLSVTQKIIIKN